ncbi:MAG: beta-ketoacyl-ACP synthase 3 [Sediminibacterium sp.]|uniref:3-oxoacyl-ACP synthase III family protein n=1 Tax=Sediminibacterium sp. TaxID=1917865 RepID=UPI002AB810D5|nr:beta-ketoacyl-ACP synthase 3 [Sediminibacterium sp.]MDZ4071403.1 beta-ketoacyl-ACP synthase 3 [Sediminibacterium sp.]
MGTIIKSFGHFIPTQCLTNSELAKRFDITEEWIIERTGIEERKYFAEGATSDMILKAALQCLSKTNVEPKDIDCIIVATMTPDFYCPSTAAIVHQKLETKNAWGFDIMAACSGYIYALELAASLINSNAYKNILVCGADKFSSIIDPLDRKTVLVFADGAGVSLLQYSELENNITDILCKLDSTYAMDVNMLNGGSQTPLTKKNIVEDNHYLRFSSKRIFEHGITLMQNAIEEILKRNKITFADIDFIIPHQANKKMIEVLAQRLVIPIEKFIINIERIGNTSAATIPIAISQALETKMLKGNERLLLASVGAGFTHAASLITLK